MSLRDAVRSYTDASQKADAIRKRMEEKERRRAALDVDIAIDAEALKDAEAAELSAQEALRVEVQKPDPEPPETPARSPN